MYNRGALPSHICFYRRFSLVYLSCSSSSSSSSPLLAPIFVLSKLATTLFSESSFLEILAHIICFLVHKWLNRVLGICLVEYIHIYMHMPTRFMSKGVVEGGGYVYGMMMPGIDEIYSSDKRFMTGKKVVFDDVCGRKGLVKDDSCSDESSSIGKNSDLTENSPEKSGGDEEIQSSYKEPLFAMESLEQVLPIRRGISGFYSGKSRSFASLADASSSSSLAKPDNAYMRKQRNLLACNLNWDRARSSSLRGNKSKRVSFSSSRTTLALAVAMSNKQAGDWRSFSLADLQQCASVVITCSNSDEFAAAKPA